MQRVKWPLIVVGGVVSLMALQGSAVGDVEPHMFGFSAADSALERTLEERYDKQINPEELRSWLKSLSSEPNNVGSRHDKENAEVIRDLFRQWGWQSHIEIFEALYPTLKNHSLELIAPTRFVASLSEPPIAGDSTSMKSGGLPPYNVYGADGDVTGVLVYLNYGMPDDYAALQRRGIDVKGKIVITRYGNDWRGLKPKLAQEHGAIGCIIYSDPQDDGYYQGDVYPKGGWRPPQGVQRGSVLDWTLYPGDPLTPGVGATKEAERLPISEARTILKIPVIPISYADAQPLLEALGGPVAPPQWRGALPITYHMGPGPAQVHLSVASDWNLKPLYDVIAEIPGTENPQQWVVRGNHRDGWVFGAWDPLSGQVAMLAEAKAIGALLKAGWKPKRTLIYASWDGEEAGLLGSTEWVEQHAAELQRKAVLYVNSDENSRGFLSSAGSHSLQHLLNDVASTVQDPETQVSTQVRLRARILTDGYEKDPSDPPDVVEEKERNARIAATGGDLPIGALGSGSDYTPFLQHLGIATLTIEYAGEEDQAGVYHSHYDSFDHYVRFGDPTFAYGVTEAETVGHFVLRMADAQVLPLQFTGFADTVSDYLAQLERLVEQKRERAAELRALLADNAFALAADPTRPIASPREVSVVALDFGPLASAISRLKEAAHAYDGAYAQSTAGGVGLGSVQRAHLNALLQGMEQKLTDPRGLPGRNWYRHLIYAPGLLTGYGAKTLPAIREAIEGDRWAEADHYVVITAEAITAYCKQLEEARTYLATRQTVILDPTDSHAASAHPQ